MSERDFDSVCYRPGECHTPEGYVLPACPRRQRELDTYMSRSTRIVPENLCIEALNSASRSRTKDPFKDALDDIEFDIERLLALPTAHVADFKKLLIGQIMDSVDKADKEQDITSLSRLPYYLRFKQFELFMPLFFARGQDRELTADIIATVRSSIALWLRDFDKTILHSEAMANVGSKTRHYNQKFATASRSELEVSYLFLRAGYFVCPTTRRQEASSARAQYNHDLYVMPISNGAVDLSGYGPVQVKESSSDSGYRDTIMIKHYDILRAMRREPHTTTHHYRPARHDPDFEHPTPYVYEQIIRGQKPDPLNELIVGEYEGTLDDAQKNALTLATAHVVSRYSDYLKHRKSR